MRRVLLVVAMVLSLAPVALIGVAVATYKSPSTSESEDVVVDAPAPDEGTASADVSPPDTSGGTVHLNFDGQTYSCPQSIGYQADAAKQTVAEHKLPLDRERRRFKAVDRRLSRLDKLYPGKTAPTAIADEYNGLLKKAKRYQRQDGRLVDRYNRAVDDYNSILSENCD